MTKVLLGGGLGNQLFQYAAGLRVSQREKLILDNSAGLARRSLGYQVDLEQFVLAGHVYVNHTQKRSFLSKKIINLSFRESARFKSKLLISLEKFVSFINKLFGKTNHRWFINSGIGWDPRIEEVSPASTLIGYFQSYENPNVLSVRKELLNLKLGNYSDLLTRKISEAEKQKPIVVHVRLSDYKLESTFGIPSNNYYRDALEALDKSNTTKSEIWLFSDSPDEARNLIPENYRTRVVVHPDAGLSPAETLELMRYGGSYVIANSTFSWWAAYLRKNQNAAVIAPDPWFSGKNDPERICPTDWLRISSS